MKAITLFFALFCLSLCNIFIFESRSLESAYGGDQSVDLELKVTEYEPPLDSIVNIDCEMEYEDNIKLPMPPMPPEPPQPTVEVSKPIQKANNRSYHMWVTATAYCPCAKCCGRGSPGITKTGRNAWTPGVAVDPRIIPLGSHLDIPGYNRKTNGAWVLCDDVGGKIKKDRIDVRFDSHREALRWGVKRIKIRVHPK
jgi:3D (Asp-Asp-Asp) domain-containing protein